MPLGAVFCTWCGYDTIKKRRTKRVNIGSDEVAKKIPLTAIIVGAATLVVVVVVVAIVVSQTAKPKPPAEAPSAPPLVDASGSNPVGPVSDSAAPSPAPAVAGSPPPSPTDPTNAAQDILCSSRPAFPEAVHGLSAFRYQLTGTGPGLPMSLLLFLPTAAVANHSLSCILLSASPQSPIVGALPTHTNAIEIRSYLQAGFAVVAYEISGEPAGALAPGSPELSDAVTRFMNADMGAANGKAAHWFAMNLPEVNGNRIFASGNGLAGTFALNLAATERLSAVAAVGPVMEFDQNTESLINSGLGPAVDPAVLRSRMILAQTSRQSICPLLLINTSTNPSTGIDFWKFAGRGTNSEFFNASGSNADFETNPLLFPTVVQYFNRFGAAVSIPAQMSNRPDLAFAQDPANAPAVTFAADPAIAAKLGPPVAIFGYSLRLPEGMSPLEGGEVKVFRTEDPHEMTLRMFVQPRKEQAIYPTVITTRDARPGPHGIPAMLKDANIERGSIGPIFFVRMIRADDSPTAIYVGFDGDKLITLFATASNAQKLDLLEAAIRTLTKAP